MNDPRPLQNRLFAVIAVPALLAALMIIPVACAKTEGEGGLATIRGRVLVKEYNSTFTVLLEEYYGYDEDVFITSAMARRWMAASVLPTTGGSNSGIFVPETTRYMPIPKTLPCRPERRYR
jgi:hypothetical protein